MTTPTPEQIMAWHIEANEVMGGEGDYRQRFAELARADLVEQLDIQAGSIEAVQAANERGAKIRADLVVEVDQLRAQLAGCGVAAMGNTEAAKDQRAKPGDFGYSVSYGEVCNAVDREIALRTERDALQSAVAAKDAKIAQLQLAEEGAKEAFGHVVQSKRDLEAECKRLRELLDGAYKSIRQYAAMKGQQ